MREIKSVFVASTTFLESLLTYHVLVEGCQRLCIGDFEERSVSFMAHNLERGNAFDFMAVVNDDDRLRRVASQHLKSRGARDEFDMMAVGGVARSSCNRKAGERKDEEETEHGRMVMWLAA